MKLGNRELRVALIVATGFIGCADGSVSSSNEKLGEVSQDWSVASCDDATPHEVVPGFIDPPITTTASYNACKKSYVVDIASYGWGSGLGSGGSFGVPLDSRNVTVRWAHALPSTETECTESMVGAIFYRRNGSEPWQDVGSGQNLNNGIWANGVCSFAPVVYEPLEWGYAYRIAATARSATDTTMSLTVQTGDPGLP